MSRPIEIFAGFESTYAPDHDVDVAESCGHIARRDSDLDLVVNAGIKRLRYPVRWHRVEEEKGAYNWLDTDASFDAMAERGLNPIVDLLHHTSHPNWTNFADPSFPDVYMRFLEAFALRYPDVQAYTLFNEPFSTLLLSGEVGAWPPYYTDTRGMVELWRNVLPAWINASQMYRELLPNAQHFHVDSVEKHSGSGSMATFANDRRFAITDLMLGHDIDENRPFFKSIVEHGGGELLELMPGHIDVLGLDYYAHNQWHWESDNTGIVPSRHPIPLACLIQEYCERYQLPCFLGETNIRGTAKDRATWFKYTLEQCEIAQEAGVEIVGHCWFPFIDSCDWDTLLRRCDGTRDPVGIYLIDDERNRHPSEISASLNAAARGASSSMLPAYKFQPPVDNWLTGWIEHMQHWEWEAVVINPRDPDRTQVDFDPLGALSVVVE